MDQSLLDYRMDDAVYRRIVNYLQDWPVSSGRMLARSARFYPISRSSWNRLTYAGTQAPEHCRERAAVVGDQPRRGRGALAAHAGYGPRAGLIVSDELDEAARPHPGLCRRPGTTCVCSTTATATGHWRWPPTTPGRGNVNRAIRRSGSRNYWKLRRFLPRETRAYVPSFIAAVFLMSYHHDFGLPATQISLDDQLTERLLGAPQNQSVRVAQVTGLRPEVVIEMNPQYVRGYLPGSGAVTSYNCPSG